MVSRSYFAHTYYRQFLYSLEIKVPYFLKLVTLVNTLLFVMAQVITISSVLEVVLYRHNFACDFMIKYYYFHT